MKKSLNVSLKTFFISGGSVVNQIIDHLTMILLRQKQKIQAF